MSLSLNCFWFIWKATVWTSRAGRNAQERCTKNYGTLVAVLGCTDVSIHLSSGTGFLTKCTGASILRHLLFNERIFI